MTENRFPYVEMPSDALLVIPVLHSGLTPDDAPVCLHLVHQEGGTLALCNTPTNETCPCCTNAVCKTHQSERVILRTGESIPLCETCLALSKAQRFALHAFVTSITSKYPQDVKQAVRETLQAFLRYKLPSRSEVREALIAQHGIELTWQEVADIWYELRHELS